MPKAVPWITTICEVCGIAFDRQPAFHRSAEAKGGKVRFCSMTCFGTAKSTGLVQVAGVGKVAVTCEVCGKSFERWRSNLKWEIARGGTVRFCSRECHGAARTARIIHMPAGTTEVNRKRSDGNRAAWGLLPHSTLVMNMIKAQRSRVARGIGFNPTQLRKWLDTSCAKCGATEKLQLDHVRCMAAGGKSVRSNAQTLCLPCNRWKAKHIDKLLVRQQSRSGGA